LRASPSNHFACARDKSEVRDLVLLFDIGFQPFKGAPVHAPWFVPNGIADAALIVEFAS
jgi:hypothetical protein